MEVWVSYHFASDAGSGFGDIGITIERGVIDGVELAEIKDAIAGHAAGNGAPDATIVIINIMELDM